MSDPRTRWQRRPRPVRVGLFVFAVVFLAAAGANLLTAVLLIDAVKEDAVDGLGRLRPSAWPDHASAAVRTEGAPIRVMRNEGPASTLVMHVALKESDRGIGRNVRAAWWRLDVGWPRRVVRRTGGGRAGGDGFFSGLQSTHVVLWDGLLLPPAGLALAVAAAAVLPGCALRWSRVRRHRCPMCTYPRGTSDTCAECGFVHGMAVDEDAATRDP